MRTRYIKDVGRYKDIENDFYSNDSPHDDSESKFLERHSWRCSNNNIKASTNVILVSSNYLNLNYLLKNNILFMIANIYY